MGEDIELVKKQEHYNKHQLDGKHIAKIMNDEDDHKRILCIYVSSQHAP